MENCYVNQGTACSVQHLRTINKRLQFILDCLDADEKGLNILDIGTGYGVYHVHLVHKAKLYVGIDVNEENLRHAKKDEKNSDLFLMSAEALSFKDDTFDVVLLIEVLEHIANDRKAIKEISRVTKPAGKLILTAPNKLFPFETHGFKMGSRHVATKGLGFPLLPYFPETLRKRMTYARVYTTRDVKRILSDAGFQPNKISFISPNLDQLRINFPKNRSLINFLTRLLDAMESIPILKVFLPTIIVCAMKEE